MQNMRWNLLFSLVVAGSGLGMGVLIGRSLAESGAVDPSQPAAQPVFTEQALGNLGVELGVASLSSYTEYRVIQAVVQDAPLNQRTVTAPLAGTVAALAVTPGVMADPAAPILSIVRDAIPRTRLEFTREIFTPVSESLHAAFTEFRTAGREQVVIQKELARIAAINASVEAGGAPLIPGGVRIQLEYDLEKSDVRVANAYSELEHHGLSAEEISQLKAGDHPPRGRDLWRRVLQVHGLWNTAVQGLHAELPAEIRDLPWTTALLGEMASTGLINQELVDALKASAALRQHFVVCAELLMQGETVDRVAWLAEQGALASRFDVRAPAGVVWDVAEVLVRAGQAVAKGDALAVLHDPRQMWLQMLPVGDEVAVVMRALGDGSVVSAVPLLRGSGPSLDGLQVMRLAGTASGDVAILPADNQLLEAVRPGASRSWSLRAGMRYQVRIPSRTHEEVYVFARDGVAKEGVDRVVYLRDGDSFKRTAVRVLYEDAETVVVARDGALFPGDGVVTRGAFALSVAMQQSSGGGHHGHTH